MFLSEREKLPLYLVLAWEAVSSVVVKPVRDWVWNVYWKAVAI